MENDIRLDAKDRKLLYELDCNSRISFAELGKRLKMTPEAVRYRFQRLQDHKVLTSCFAVIDSGMIGFTQYKLFLKFQSVSPEEIKQIVQVARASKMALRVLQFDGPYDLDIVCKVTSIEEFDRFVTSLVGQFSTFVRKRSVAVNVWARYLPRSYMVGRDRSKYFDRGYGAATGASAVDETDRFILGMLAENSRVSATEISEAMEKSASVTALSSFAIGKRIEKLERLKVITGYSLTIRNEPLGQTMFKVLLYMNALSESDSRRFVSYCLRHRHVVHIMKTLGEWDYELDVELQDVRELHSFLMDLTREFPRAVKDYVTLHYMQVLKYRFMS